MASHFCGVFSNPSGRSLFPCVEKSGKFLPDAPKRACVEAGDGSGKHGEWLGCIFPQMFSLFQPLERFVFLMHFTMALSFALDAQSGILSALPKGKRMFGFPVVSMLLVAALTVRNFEAKTALLPDAAVLLLALMYFEMGAGILIRLHENRAQ